ncbi:hypothetical protein ABZ769_14825 [Streptomyces olivoreticuli]
MRAASSYGMSSVRASHSAENPSQPRTHAACTRPSYRAPGGGVAKEDSGSSSRYSAGVPPRVSRTVGSGGRDRTEQPLAAAG